MALAFVVALEFMPARQSRRRRRRRGRAGDPAAGPSDALVAPVTRRCVARRVSGSRGALVLLAARCCSPLRPRPAAPSQGSLAARRHRVGVPAEPRPKNWPKKYVADHELREEQDPPCETSAEQYQPTSVDTVLGNPTVTLQHVAEGRDGSKTIRQGADRRRHRRARRRLLPRTSTATRSATPASTRKDFKQAARRKARRRPSPTPTSPANRATPGSPSSTGSSGTSTSSTTCTRATGRGCRSPSKRNTAGEALHEEPSEIILFQHAGGERADWERRQGAEGRDAPGRLPGGGLARDLLRLRRLRPERPARLRPRLRQHHRTAARTAAAPGADARTRCRDNRAVRLAHLLRPLGRTRKGLQQRPDRAADEDRVARTVRLDGEAAHDQPAAAGRLDRRAAGDEAPSAAPSPPPPN